MMLVIWQDLSKLNRDPAKIIYVSGHALESTLQPENSLPIKPWKLEEDDTALLDLIPFLECKWPGVITSLCRLHYISASTYDFLGLRQTLLDIDLLTFDLC